MARELFGQLDLAGRRVALDALHTEDQTGRDLVLEHRADYLLTVKNNQPILPQNIEKLVPFPKRVFSLLPVTPTRARTVEKNKGAQKSRTIETRSVAPEDIGFPLAAQAAIRVRQHTGRKDEIVALVTGLSPKELSAQQWLRANRQGWGIENGLHRRLDVSLNDDRHRLRSTNGLWIMGMFRRLADSLVVEWLSHQPKPQHKSTTDFQTVMGEDNLAKAMRFITSKRPHL